MVEMRSGPVIGLSVDTVSAGSDRGDQPGDRQDLRLPDHDRVCREEPTATTSEMSRSVNGAAGGTNDIAQNITGVAESARATSQSAAESEQATTQLARHSTELSDLVSGFAISPLRPQSTLPPRTLGPPSRTPSTAS